MRFINKITPSLILILLLSSCANYKTQKSIQDKPKKYYSSNGFALVYDDNMYTQGVVNKKINNDKIIAMHSFLKRNTTIKITNPKNSKSVDLKINRILEYPKIFNIVISKKVADILDLDINNPYVEIIEVKKNRTFIAKEGVTFEEERKVAQSVPVDEIKMNDLSINTTKDKKKKNEKNKFTLIISDFYYLTSANNLKKELMKQTEIDNFLVKKINNNKYRLLVGPFKNFNAMKSTYISLNNLGFEELNIIRE